VSSPSRQQVTDLLLDPFDVTWHKFSAAAQAVPDEGFGGVWTWDHLAGQVHQAQTVLECWTALAAVAGRVSDVAIGPLVLNVDVAGERLLLGLGAGGGRMTPYASEQQALGRTVAADPVRRRQVEQAIQVMRQLWVGQARPIAESDLYPLGSGRGFPRPDPPPPIIIGAFGPKMAELAGRLGDGINTQAWHPQLAGLLDAARSAHASAGRDPARFLVTVFAGLESRWLDERRPERSRLRDLGVDRLVLIVSPTSARDIRDAARFFRG